jgi:hypothetical protein
VSVQLGPEWQQLADRLQREPAQLEADMRRVLQQSLLYIERDARHLAPQDTRRLAGSINSRVSGTFPNLVGEVGPTPRYGVVMEFGRRAGARMPPVDALIGWVRRHWNPAFVGPIQRGQLRPRRAAGGNVAQQAIRSRAFALARSIQRRGIRAQPYMAPATRQNIPRIERAFARIGLRVVARLAGQQIQ